MLQLWLCVVSSLQQVLHRLRRLVRGVERAGHFCVLPEAEFEKEWSSIKSSMFADFSEQDFVHNLLKNIHRQYPKEHQLKAFTDLWTDAEVLERDGEVALMKALESPVVVRSTLRGATCKPYPDKKASYVDILNVLRECALEHGEKRNPWDVVWDRRVELDPTRRDCGAALVGIWTGLGDQLVDVQRGVKCGYEVRFGQSSAGPGTCFSLKPPSQLLRRWILTTNTGKFWLTRIDHLEGTVHWQRKKLVSSGYVDAGAPIVWKRVEDPSQQQWVANFFASTLSTLQSATVTGLHTAVEVFPLSLVQCGHRKPGGRESLVSYLSGRRDVPASTQDLQEFATHRMGWDTLLRTVERAVQDESQCNDDDVRSDVSHDESAPPECNLDTFLGDCARRSVRPLTPSLIHAVCCRLESVVDDVNSELRFLSCELSIHGKGFIHTLGTLLLWRTVKQHELDTFLLPIRAFDSEKGPQRDYFIEALKGGDFADVANAQSLARHFASKIREILWGGPKSVRHQFGCRSDPVPKHVSS